VIELPPADHFERELLNNVKVSRAQTKQIESEHQVTRYELEEAQSHISDLTEQLHELQSEYSLQVQCS
jgi:hypothetical protein